MSEYADPIDQAAAATEALTTAAIERAKQHSGPRLRPTGRCHNCRDPLKLEAQLFCDEDCAEDYEYVEQRRRANRNVI